MSAIIILVKAKKGMERNVRAVLSARGFKANVVPGNFNIIAEIKTEDDKALKSKIEEAKKIDGVIILETFPAYWDK